MTGKGYNFSAGPAMLPEDVLKKAQQELLDWQGEGASVMEISHRSSAFLKVVDEAEKNLRALLAIPDNYHVLYAQGGARGQFAAVPMNLLGENTRADYIDTGYWAKSAIKEAEQFCTPDVVNVLIEKDGKQAVLPVSEWTLNETAAYVHLCPNETIDGIALNALPQTNKPIVADMSSCILSAPIDVSQYGVIYAGAQKNIGPAGITLVIVRDDLLGKAKAFLPSILNYTVLANKESMFNTPPTFGWYLAGEVYKWLLSQGGLIEMAQKNQTKAALLYDAIDNSSFYVNKIHPDNRSLMNVPFWLTHTELEARFLKEAERLGLKGLKGHRDVGGIRASLYNAMPLEGVQALVDFMQEFETNWTA